MVFLEGKNQEVVGVGDWGGAKKTGSWKKEGTVGDLIICFARPLVLDFYVEVRMAPHKIDKFVE